MTATTHHDIVCSPCIPNCLKAQECICVVWVSAAIFAALSHSFSSSVSHEPKLWCVMVVPVWHYITTNILPNMDRSTTSCMWVICDRKKCPSTLCSSGNTIIAQVKIVWKNYWSWVVTQNVYGSSFYYSKYEELSHNIPLNITNQHTMQ